MRDHDTDKNGNMEVNERRAWLKNYPRIQEWKSSMEPSSQPYAK